MTYTYVCTGCNETLIRGQLTEKSYCTKLDAYFPLRRDYKADAPNLNLSECRKARA